MIYALSHSDGSLTDMFRGAMPPPRDEGQWITIDAMPTGLGPWKLQGTTAVLDEVAKAAQEAAESKAALVELFKEKAAIEAAAAAAPSLDYSAELTAIDAQIAAVVGA
jgi:hypothetical protein